MKKYTEKPSTPRTKITILGPVPPPLGGVSVHVLREKELLEAAGFHCYISPLGGWFENGITISSLVNAMSKTLIAVFRSLFSKSSYLHLHYSRWFYSLPILISAKIGGNPLVVTFHSSTIQLDIDNLSGFLASRLIGLLSEADLIISVSRNIEYSLTKLGIKARRKMVVLPAFLTPSEKEISANSLSPHGLTLYKKLRDSGDMIILASAYNVGSGYGYEDVYGLEFLVKTIASMISTDKITLLISVSKKPQGIDQIQAESRLQKLETSSKLDVKLVYGEAMLPFLSIADAYIRPSRIDGDSVAIREAISLGIPCGVSNVVQRPEGIMLFDLTAESLQTVIVSILKSDRTEKRLSTLSDNDLINEIHKLLND